jgi:hypothetical protein
MKTRKLLIALLLPASFALSAFAGDDQDSLGLPGDNLDLYGTLELFKKSNSLEEFEKALNTESNKLNNLDLNGDGKTDYIRVEDHMESEAHAIRLSIAVNNTESQDVAVIEVEKTAEGTANLQIVGDEDLYGKGYLVEPKDEKEDGPKSGLDMPDDRYSDPRDPGIVFVNVWGWPCIRYIYAPVYVVWVSPWHWGYYPGWWYGWAPYPWPVYHKHYWYCHGYYYRSNNYHMYHAHKVYYAHRTTSPTYYKQYHGEHGGGNVKPGPYGNKDMKPGPKPGPKTMPGPKGSQKNTGPKNTAPKPKPMPGPRKSGGGAPKPMPGPKGGGGKGHK